MCLQVPDSQIIGPFPENLLFPRDSFMNGFWCSTGEKPRCWLFSPKHTVTGLTTQLCSFWCNLLVAVYSWFSFLREFGKFIPPANTVASTSGLNQPRTPGVQVWQWHRSERLPVKKAFLFCPVWGKILTNELRPLLFVHEESPPDRVKQLLSSSSNLSLTVYERVWRLWWILNK